MTIMTDEKTEKIQKDIVEGTAGKAQMLWGDSVWYALIEKKLEIF